MKLRNLIIPILAVLGLLLAAGCSTVETRIAKNQDFFNRLKPEQQAVIRKGEVAIGFDAEMVKLALGEPDRVRERMDTSGRVEIWSYTTWETHDGMLLYRGFYHRWYGWGGHYGRRGGYYGGWGDPFFPYPYFDYYPARRARDYMRVAFRNGRVIEIERDLRGW